MPVLSEICKQWESLIQQAKKDKWEKFGEQAHEANQFYQSDDHSFIFRRDSDSPSGLRVNTPEDAPAGMGSGLSFEATANLTANVVSVFLPVLYHKNPNRVLRARTPTVPPALIAAYRQAQMQEMLDSLQQQVMQNPALAADPGLAQQAAMMQQQMATPPQQGPTKREIEDKLRASLIEWYLNYTPAEARLMDKSRDGIIEGIVKGMGLLWATVDTTSERRIACLEYDSVDHLLIDPDCEKIEDAKWIARRRRRPLWEIEREFGIEPGALKPSGRTSESEAIEESVEDKFDTEEGKSSQNGTYWEIYSRMGVGARIPSIADDADEGIVERIEQFGDFAFLAIMPGHDEPLNLPQQVLDFDETGEETRARLEWPIPFYKNRANPWPCARLSFRKKSRCAWPMSYVGPALAYQKCINWILSFLMARIKIVSRALILMPDNLEDEIYNAVLYGSDLTLLKLKSAHPQEFEKFAQFVSMPEEKGNIWQLLQHLKREYEDATGVNELNLSARTNQQMRSAAEADLKRDVMAVRPDDMAKMVDAWMSDAAKLEAIAARYLLTAEDVAPIFGEDQPQEVEMGPGQTAPQYGQYTQLWIDLVMTDDVDRIVSEYEYTIESGSSRAPNKTQQVQNMDEGVGLGSVPEFLNIWRETGDPSKFNAFVEEWGRTRDMANWHVYALPDMRAYIAEKQAIMAAQGGGPPGGGGAPPPQQSPPQDGGGPPQ